MPNAGYRTGSDFERHVQDMIRQRGWWALRSAGSHSPADLVALKAGHAPMVVQCKAGKAQVDWQQWARLWAVAQMAGATPVIAQRVLRSEPVLWLVTGPRPARANPDDYTAALPWDHLGMVVHSPVHGTAR